MTLTNQEKRYQGTALLYMLKAGTTLHKLHTTVLLQGMTLLYTIKYPLGYIGRGSRRLNEALYNERGSICFRKNKNHHPHHAVGTSQAPPLPEARYKNRVLLSSSPPLPTSQPLVTSAVPKIRNELRKQTTEPST
jgi:hypothetical protein